VTAEVLLVLTEEEFVTLGTGVCESEKKSVLLWAQGCVRVKRAVRYSRNRSLFL